MQVVKTDDTRTDAERVACIKEHGVELYKALLMMLQADDNRSAIVAVEAAKLALKKATLGGEELKAKEVKKIIKSK